MSSNRNAAAADRRSISPPAASRALMTQTIEGGPSTDGRSQTE